MTLRLSPVLIPVVLALVGCAGGRRVPDVSRVTAFSINAQSPANPRCLSVYGPSGAMCSDVDARTVVLSPGEQARLEALLRDPSTWTESAEGCFQPRHGFVWSGPDGQRKKQLAVSLSCAVVAMDPPDKAFAVQADRMGLSASGVEGLRELCMAIEMPACEELGRPE